MAQTFVSPLEKWPGSFELPDHDEFTGAHWDIWRKALEAAPDNTLNRRMCYAGLALVEKCGQWNMEIPLAEVAGWKKNPAEERMYLVSWIGRSVGSYIDELIDPKG